MQGNHATMDWITKRKDERGNIHTYFPEARSVIAVGMNYYTGNEQDDLRSDYKFSNYAWESNFGYGTKAHLNGLRKFGITSHHRKGFKPVHKILSR